MSTVKRYIKYSDVKDEYTTITLVHIPGTEIKIIDKGFAVISSELEENINTFIDSQDERLSITQIPKEVFLEAVKDCHLIKVIDEATGKRIRDKYTIEQELSMLHKEATDPRKIEYLEFRDIHLEIGRKQKEEIGL
ncbi:hypothetical protein HOO31_04990 [Aliarcobacter cryaerophilus]|uniref:hypothetical protein n=1 Tax=Aliarcobacter cryaerophilus TaxID=28198 RepID=UPI00164C557B|nr:hypothetical protein [Aliarcobacter cryaerophilus]QNK85967.1 hypothetical protein HOO31_04990 [Aliarcobacter cryaerophilus]